MPTAPIIIQVGAATGVEGEKVYVKNITKEETVELTLDSSKRAAINITDAGKTWVSGDIIYVYMTGRVKGGTSATLTAAGVKVTLSVTADTTTTPINF